MVSQTFSYSKLSQIAQSLLQNNPNTRVFCFYGDMGAGKTTLIKELLQQLDAVDAGNSPTFGVVNEHYDANENLLAYHFDCYRLETEEEAYDLGIEEYWDTGAYIFIEWPERIANLLPKGHLPIKMRFVDESMRFIEY